MEYNHFKLSDWLLYLENRHVHEIQLGLERVSEVASILGLLSPSPKVITVAGTNGKGSVVVALETIYASAGYRVGSYSSPHLVSFTERIRINQQAVTEEQLCHVFRTIESLRKDIKLTYFEMTTLAALMIFRDSSLDIIILEVGLGGRLDATNIIDADVAVITTIDFDHQAYLGNTLEEIAYEKAGIMRANKPVIYADTHVPQNIIQSALRLGAQLFLADQDFTYSVNDEQLMIDFYGKQQWCLAKPRIHPLSASAAVMATELLKTHLPIAKQDYQKAMSSVYNPGRLDLRQGAKSVLFDVAHNAQSAQLLADFMSKLNITGRIYAVFSALSDKDHEGLIRPVCPFISAWYVAPLQGKRGTATHVLRDKIKKIASNSCHIEDCDDLSTAYQRALNDAECGDLVVVFGSFLVVGSIMAMLSAEQKEVL